MNHEERQAELLDTYLDALRKNPDAAIPEGLEADMAEFAKMMMPGQETVADDKGSRQSRVWQQIQDSPEIMPFHAIQDEFQEMNPRMRKLYEKQKRSGERSGWFPMAAAAIIAFIIGLAVMPLIYRNDDSQQGASLQDNVTVVTATPLPLSFTPTMIPTMLPPDGSDPVEVVSTLPAVEMVASMVPTSTPFMLQPTVVPPDNLVCDFEDDLLLRLNLSAPGADDILIVSGAARTQGTKQLSVEIFGGLLTDDVYVPIVEISNPSATEQQLASIQGDAYTPGNYLLQLRLTDSRGETLSSCALPVTFTGR